jgi:hypothetical protein
MADVDEDDGGPMLDEPAGGSGSGKRFEVKKWNAVSDNFDEPSSFPTKRKNDGSHFRLMGYGLLALSMHKF